MGWEWEIFEPQNDILMNVVLYVCKFQYAAILFVTLVIGEARISVAPTIIVERAKSKVKYMATESSEGEDEVKLTGGNQVLVVDDDLREMGKKAAWSVSSCKTGNGVSSLRDDNLDTYWQSLLSLFPSSTFFQFLSFSFYPNFPLMLFVLGLQIRRSSASSCKHSISEESKATSM